MDVENNLLPRQSSGKTKAMVLNHKMEMESLTYRDTWRSCCGLIIDRRLLMYLAQILMIAGIMIFCICQLLRLKQCADQQAYLSLLMLLIGILCPSPVISSSKSGPSNIQPVVAANI